MSESKAKKKRTRRYLDEHPFCYFCGGARLAITVDHVPPRACFPDGFAPEGFESPACKACNQGADKQDQIFGLYAMMLDFDPAKFASEEQALRAPVALAEGSPCAVKKRWSAAGESPTRDWFVPLGNRSGGGGNSRRSLRCRGSLW